MVTSIDRQETKVELKPGWRMVRFGDVVRNVDINERDPLAKGLERYVGLDHLDPESLHIRRWGMIEEGTTFTRTFVDGQVLFGKRRAYQRKVAVAEFAGICSGDILVFEARDELLPELLPFIVQSDPFYEYAVNTSAGSLSPRTKWKDLAAYEFALPPKEEQQKIADILWAADEANTAWQSTLDALNTIKQNYLTALFSEAEQDVASERSDWTLKRLDEIAFIQTGIAKGKHYGNEPTTSRPYLRVANVQDDYLDLSEIKEIVIATKDTERYSLRMGDVLLTEGGDADKLGRGTIWREEIEGCLHQNHIFCVRPDSHKLLSEFLSLQTGSEYGKGYFASCSKQTTNLASINVTQVKNFPLLLPSLERQKAITGYVTHLKKSIKEANQHITRTEQLKKRLLKAFLTLEISI